jgi:6-phosphogluconolactonase
LSLRTLAGAEVGAGGQPILDLVFLGMGEDGHVASLFPGAPESVVAGPATYVPVIGPKPPPQRVSLTYGSLLAAREVWVLASGKGKETAWKESKAGPGTPLGRVLAGRIQTRVFTDIAQS